MIARPVGLVARGNHDALDGSRLPACCLEDVVGPADVGFECEERSVEADPNEGLRTEVKNDRGAALGDRAFYVGEGLKLAPGDGDPLDVAAAEQLGPAIVVAQQDGDVRARCQKRGDKVRSDDPGRPRYENWPCVPIRARFGHGSSFGAPI